MPEVGRFVYKLIKATLIVLSLTLAAGQGRSAPLPEERARVMAIAAMIEKDASSSTYEALGDFGQKALSLKGPDKFVRLQYISEEYIENIDIEKFKHWNSVLRDQAKAENSSRYTSIAEVHLLVFSVLMGDPAAFEKLTQIAKTADDWYVKSHALLQLANLSSAMRRNADSLRLVREAETGVRGRGIEASYMRMQILEARAFRLLAAYDLFGAAQIMEDVATIYHGLKFPRPNTQELFNMSAIAIRLGDKDLAESLTSAYARLARPTDSPSQKLTHATLCAGMKETFGTPQEVLACIEPVSADIEQGGPVSWGLLFGRGTASARLGQVGIAERDFATLKAMKSKGMLPPAAFNRLDLLEAELKAARGDSRGALDQMRANLRAVSIADAQIYDASRREISQEYARNLQLRAQLVDSQRMIIAIALAALAGGGVMLALQIRLANRYRVQRQKAQAATAAKDVFLSNMSHEIRTPLTAVIGFAELLAKRHDLPDDARPLVAKVMDGGNALLLIVNDVLDFSKIESGQLELDPRPFNPFNIVSTAVGLVEGLATAKGLSLTLESANDLPELVVGDAGRLQQAILNLVNNAVKFTSSGSVRVRLTYDRGAGRLCCAVTDTGPGIPIEKQDLLFKRFSQVDNTVSRVYGGSGLGLAITRSLVELMGGQVSLESIEGQGSTFSFYVAAPVASPSDAQPKDGGNPANWLEDQGPRILIVDDREENREILRQMIGAVGLMPILASSGDEGLAMTRETQFALILMDVRMPGLSGLEASRMIREPSNLNAKTPILAITANVAPGEIEECRQAGMQDHIAKPIRAADLIQKISAWIDQEA